MPLEVSTLRDQEAAKAKEEPMHKLTQRTCLDSTQTKVVDCNSPEAHFQLGNAGKEIPESRARALGLLVERKQAEPEEDKQLKAAVEDKSAKPTKAPKRTKS